MPAVPLVAGSLTRSNDMNGGSNANGSPSVSVDITVLVKEHKTHNRVKEAYECIRQLPAGASCDSGHDIGWLKLYNDVMEAYRLQFPADVNELFCEKYFECLRSLVMCYLRLNNTTEAESALQLFDQVLWIAFELKCNKNSWSSYLTFVAGDFLSLCADLLLLKLRKGKKVTDWKRVCRLAAYCYAQVMRNKERPSMTWWRRLATFNLLQANQMLCSIRQYFEDERQWTNIVESLQTTQIVKDLFSLLFPPISQHSDKTSYTLTKLTPLKNVEDLHTLSEELNTDCYREMLCCRDTNTLDYVVWSLLFYWNADRSILTKSDDVELLEKSLNFAPSCSTSTVTVSDLSQLDLKAFLHFSVHCCALRNERLGSKLKRYPFNLTAFLTNEWQKKFWSSCVLLVSERANAEARTVVTDCLNVVRLRSRNVPAFQLIYSTAMYLEHQCRQYKMANEQKYRAMSDYAKLYWSYLHKNLQEGIQTVSKADSPFYVNLTAWSKGDRDRILDVCKFYMAINCSMHGQYEEALDVLKKLSFPQAFKAQTEIYVKLADLINVKSDNKDEAMLKRRALITKAQQAMQSARNAAYFSDATAFSPDSYEDGDTVDSAGSLFDQSSSSFYAAESGTSDTADYRTPIGHADIYFTPKINGNVQHMQVATPSVARSGSRQNPMQPMSTDSGQSLDYTVRSLTNVNEFTVRSVLDQNRVLNESVRSMTDNVRELTLVNKGLVEELKELRKHFADMQLQGGQKVEPAVQPTREQSHFVHLQQQRSMPVFAAQPQYPGFSPQIPFGTLPLNQMSYQQQLAAANVALPMGQFFDQQQLPLNAANYNYNYTNAATPFYNIAAAASNQSLADTNVDWLQEAADMDIAATLPLKVCSVAPAQPTVVTVPNVAPSMPTMMTSSAVKATPSAVAPTTTSRTPATSVVAQPPITTTPAAATTAGALAFTKTPTVATTTADRQSLFAAFSFGKPALKPSLLGTPTTVTEPSKTVATTAVEPPKTVKESPKTGNEPLKTGGTTVTEPSKTVTKAEPVKPVAQASSFGSTTAAVASAAGLFGSTTTPMLSFSQVAAQKSTPAVDAQKTSPAFKGFAGAGQPVFGSHTTPKADTVDKKSPVVDRQASHDDQSAEEPFEPTAEFQPLIPLPALVDVKTGEEDETVLFKERAKLFRFDKDTNEFKERGLGDLKLLKNDKGRVRLLMRREQTLKLCANHYLAANMKLLPLAKSDRAYTWQCQDFADNELKSETLAIRFKTREQADQFKMQFEKIAEDLAAAECTQKVLDLESSQKKEEKMPSTGNITSTGFGDKFKAKPGSWNCPSCTVNNGSDCTVCPCCGTAKDGSTPAKTESKTANFGEKPSFKFESPVNFGFGSLGSATTAGTPTSALGGSGSGPDGSKSGTVNNGSATGPVSGAFGFGTAFGQSSSGAGSFSFGFVPGGSIFGNTPLPASAFGAGSATAAAAKQASDDVAKAPAADGNNVNKREAADDITQCPGCMGCSLSDEELDRIFGQLKEMSYKGPRYPFEYEDDFD